MIKIRRSEERGVSEYDWLKSYHTFSFGNYYDPESSGFRALRVINDDIIGPGGGFGTHPHAHMEIITVVLSGALEHRDSLGNGEVLRPGEVQVMSAGTGIEHSEFNHSKTEPVHLIQIWIIPDRKGGTPGYTQKRFTDEARKGKLCCVAAAAGTDPTGEALTIKQDAKVFVSTLAAGDSVTHQLAGPRGAWAHVMTGTLVVNGQGLHAGDAAYQEGGSLTVESRDGVGELLLFDLN